MGISQGQFGQLEEEEQEDMLEQQDATAVTHKTFDTFASDWSGCTNMAFDKVINKFKASNAGHKDMLAVLAAVTEVKPYILCNLLLLFLCCHLSYPFHPLVSPR